MYIPREAHSHLSHRSRVRRTIVGRSTRRVTGMEMLWCKDKPATGPTGLSTKTEGCPTQLSRIEYYAEAFFDDVRLFWMFAGSPRSKLVSARCLLSKEQSACVDASCPPLVSVWNESLRQNPALQSSVARSQKRGASPTSWYGTVGSACLAVGRNSTVERTTKGIHLGRMTRKTLAVEGE